MAVHAPLHPAEVGVDAGAGRVVAVIVEPAKAQKEHGGGAQFGQKVAVAGLEAFVDRGEEPGANLLWLKASRRERRPGARRQRRPQAAHAGKAGSALGIGAPDGNEEGLPDLFGGGGVQHHFARGGVVLGCGHTAHGLSG
jgi:hypothetical protein